MKWCLIVGLMTGLCWLGPDSVQGRAGRRGQSTKAAKARKSPKRGKVTAKAIKKKVTTKRRLSKAEKRRAKKYWQLGRRLFRQKKYAKSAEAFKKAYAIRKHPQILYNIALVLALGGKTLESASHLRQYRELKKGLLKKLPLVLRQALDGTGVLVVKTPDPKAAILVDGHQVGLGSARITALTGRRAVDIVVKTRIVARRIINLGSDSIKIWELFEIPQALVVKPRVRPRERRRVARRVVTPPPDHVPPPPTRWQKMRKLHWVYFVSAAGLAVAALGASIGLSMTIQNVDRDCRAAPCTAAKSDRGFALQKATNAMWGLTAAAALAAGVLVLFTRWRKRERAGITITPSLGAGSVGLGMRWDH